MDSKETAYFAEKITFKIASLITMQLPRSAESTAIFFYQLLRNRLCLLVRYGIGLHPLCEVIAQDQHVAVPSLRLGKRA